MSADPVDTEDAILIVDAIRDCIDRLAKLPEVKHRCKVAHLLNQLFNRDEDGEDNYSE
jgi:hypothetical protein